MRVQVRDGRSISAKSANFALDAYRTRLEEPVEATIEELKIKLRAEASPLHGNNVATLLEEELRAIVCGPEAPSLQHSCACGA